MLIAQKAKAAVQKFAKREDGVTAIEYGLIAALISLAVAVSIFAFGDTLYNMFYSDLPSLFG